MLPWCEQSLQPKGCPGPRLQCGCRKRWFVTSALVPHLLQPWDYPWVSSGGSIPAVGIGMVLPGRDCCTALGGNCDAALVGLKGLLERPALLHPTSMPSQICRLRFGRGSKDIKSCGFNRVWGICSKNPCSSTRVCSFPFSSQSSCWFDFAKYFSASLIVGQVKFPVLIFEQG